MTRKRYTEDEPNEDQWEDNQRKKEIIEQKQYEEYLRKEYLRTTSFIERNFDELFDMFEDLTTNVNNIYILDNCKLNAFSDLVEIPTKYDDTETDYGRDVWVEDNREELKCHYKCLNRFNLFKNGEKKEDDKKKNDKNEWVEEKNVKKRITQSQFNNFCYLNTSIHS